MEQETPKGEDPSSFSAYAVDEDKAFQHAAIALIELIISKKQLMIDKSVGRISWIRARIGEPILLFDINEQPLCYAYPVSSGDGKLLARVSVAANKLLGNTAFSVDVNPIPWDFIKANAHISELSAEKIPGGRIERIMPVIYDMPNVGIMAIIKKRGSDKMRKIILDLQDLSQATEISWTRLKSQGFRIKGHVSWSILELACDAPEKSIENWYLHDKYAQSFDKILNAYGWSSSDLRNTYFDFSELPDLKTISSDFIFESMIIPIPRYFGEKGRGYCTVGVAQMIAAYYGIYDKRDDVIKIMGIPWRPPDESLDDSTLWATAEDELKYYRDGLGMKDSMGFSAVGDRDILLDWRTYYDEIKNGRPSNMRQFSMSHSHHSRLLCGIRFKKLSSGDSVIELGYLDPMAIPSHQFDETPAGDLFWDRFTPEVFGDKVGGYPIMIAGLIVVRSGIISLRQIAKAAGKIGPIVSLKDIGIGKGQGPIISLRGLA